MERPPPDLAQRNRYRDPTLLLARKSPSPVASTRATFPSHAAPTHIHIHAHVYYLALSKILGIIDFTPPGGQPTNHAYPHANCY